MIAFLVLLADVPTLDISFHDEETPYRLRVMLSKGPDSASLPWERFTEQLFQHADTNNDGKLFPKEVSRLIALPLADGGTVKPDFTKMDADRDDAISLKEFREFYRLAGFGPFIHKVAVTSNLQAQVAETLWKLVDSNSDKALSQAELSELPKLLKRLDTNEDERLDASEILAAGSEKMKPVEGRVKVQGQQPIDGKGPFTLQLDWTKPQQRQLNTPKNRVFKVIVDPTNRNTAFRSTKEFYLAQFGEALNGQTSLSKADVEADNTLTVVAELFNFADRNADGKLEVKELTSVLNLIEAGLSCQFLLSVSDRGQSLFDQLDQDGDGLLHVGELAKPPFGEGLKKVDLPRIYGLELTRGSPTKQFGSVPVPAFKPKSATASKPAVGPSWFRAMDRNGDGFVSKLEFRGSPELFKQLDRDNDSRISSYEATLRK